MENYKFGSVKLELGVSGYMDILILNTYLHLFVTTARVIPSS